MVAHEVGNTHGGGSTDASHAVHERLAALVLGGVDAVSDLVEVGGEFGVGRVVHADLVRLQVRHRQRFDVERQVDDGRDAVLPDVAFRHGRGAAQEEVVRDLSDLSEERHRQPVNEKHVEIVKR